MTLEELETKKGLKLKIKSIEHQKGNNIENTIRLKLPSKNTIKTSKNTILNNEVNQQETGQKDDQQETQTKNMTEEAKQRKHNRVREIYRLLNNKYPTIINRSTSKMLAEGINREIATELNISIREASLFCSWYCGVEYQKAMKEGLPRYNLKGEITGCVTTKHADYAKRIIESKQNKLI